MGSRGNEDSKIPSSEKSKSSKPGAKTARSKLPASAQGTSRDPIQDLSDDDFQVRSKHHQLQEQNEKEPFTCIICKSDLTAESMEQRSVHVNGCIDHQSYQDRSTDILECPFCFKHFPASELRSSHIIRCGRSRGMCGQSIISAFRLQEKHASERKALGLPINTKKPTKQKKTGVKNSCVDPKSKLQSDLLLAKALSLSLQEEVKGKQLGDFPSSASLRPPSEHENPGKATKGIGIVRNTALLLRSKEDRERIINEKAKVILEANNKLESIQHLNKDNRADEKGSKLWSLCSRAEDNDQYYVEQLLDWIQPTDIEVGSKLRSLSQVPGYKICTQKPVDFTFSSSQNEIALSTEDCNEGLSLLGGLKSLIGNSWMSDLDICVASDIIIPAHKLVLGIRCPPLKKIFDNSSLKGKYVLNWKDVSFDAALHFLNFIYTGSKEWKEDTHQEIAHLADRYKVYDLINLLKSDTETLELLIEMSEQNKSDKDPNSMIEEKEVSFRNVNELLGKDTVNNNASASNSSQSYSNKNNSICNFNNLTPPIACKSEKSGENLKTIRGCVQESNKLTGSSLNEVSSELVNLVSSHESTNETSNSSDASCKILNSAFCPLESEQKGSPRKATFPKEEEKKISPGKFEKLQQPIDDDVTFLTSHNTPRSTPRSHQPAKRKRRQQNAVLPQSPVISEVCMPMKSLSYDYSLPSTSKYESGGNDSLRTNHSVSPSFTSYSQIVQLLPAGKAVSGHVREESSPEVLCGESEDEYMSRNTSPPKNEEVTDENISDESTCKTSLTETVDQSTSGYIPQQSSSDNDSIEAVPLSERLKLLQSIKKKKAVGTLLKSTFQDCDSSNSNNNARCSDSESTKNIDSTQSNLRNTTSNSPINCKPQFKFSDSPITPFPDYKKMSSPGLKEALKKIGVKALPRKKAISVLTHVYDETHPFCSSSSSSFENDSACDQSSKKVNKKRKSSNNRSVKNTKRNKVSSTNRQIRSNGDSINLLTSLRSRDPLNLNSSLESSDHGFPIIRNVNQIKEYVLAHEGIYKRVLGYIPLNLSELHQELKRNRIKVSIKHLMDYLDEQSITFTFPRKEEYKKKQQARAQRFRKRMVAKLSQQANPT